MWEKIAEATGAGQLHFIIQNSLSSVLSDHRLVGKLNAALARWAY